MKTEQKARREGKFQPWSIVHGKQAPAWVVLLAYLAYLRAMQPQERDEVRLWRTLILTAGLVLVAIALIVAGAAGSVVDLVKHWPVIP